MLASAGVGQWGMLELILELYTLTGCSAYISYNASIMHHGTLSLTTPHYLLMPSASAHPMIRLADGRSTPLPSSGSWLMNEP